jgi:hypothetical protein
MKNPETHAALGIKHWGKIYKTKTNTKRLPPTITKSGNETKVKRKKHNKKKNTHSEPNKTSRDWIQLQ